MWGSMSLKLWDKRLPADGIDQWIKEDILPEGHRWDDIIYDPRVTHHWICSTIDGKGPLSTPRRFANSVYNSSFVSDLLQACREEKGERVLIIVCEIPDPKHGQVEDSPAKPKAGKDEPESKKGKGKGKAKSEPTKEDKPAQSSYA
ncbi:hypothetical protein HO173_003154 [Letharia columbiana]|uniref:Uncharacterized protein n=1 Tax=Letharia columbiana TaxID=112416 RepID=A0A8H6L7S0_9LECA|nr:uncharacterized protein HO173_003154 [Letharia columbiana]KAF6238648.1 hypothetical protein HO173_003154 [Letharia columbiana]